MKRSDTLTKAEMQVMNALWEMPEGGCIHDIIAHYPDPPKNDSLTSVIT